MRVTECTLYRETIRQARGHGATPHRQESSPRLQSCVACGIASPDPTIQSASLICPGPALWWRISRSPSQACAIEARSWVSRAQSCGRAAYHQLSRRRGCSGLMCERFSLTYGRSWTWWDCLASKCESRRLPELRVEAPLRDLREDDQLLRSVDLRCEAERGRFRGIASREAWRPMESRPR